jgi:hypothetical protein
MKQMKKYFFAFLLVFAIGGQLVEAQEIRSDLGVFFSSNNKYAYRTICRLFAPNNEYINGRFSMKDNKTMHVVVSCDDGDIYLDLHLAKDRFDTIDIKPIDWAAPYVSSKVLKSFADELVKKYKPDIIKWIENKMGKRIHQMNAKEMCLTALTMHYWLYDDLTPQSN